MLIFNTNSLPFDGAFTEQDKSISQKLLTLWTSFVHNGHKPDVDKFNWIPLNDVDKSMLEISSSGLNMVPVDYDILNYWAQNIWSKIPPRIHLKQKKFLWQFNSTNSRENSNKFSTKPINDEL